MSEERRKILDMLSAGKISAAEAERLLDAIGRPAAEESTVEPKKKPKFLKVKVEPKSCEGKGERVNIKIPLSVLRAGAKLSGFLPDEAKMKIQSKLKDKGIGVDLNSLDSGKLEDVICCLGEMSIDVDDEDETVKIYCE
ncbi:MAG: hypothetical protein JSU69_02700 [Candidatus Zixiibacteriota bacterium]|nr:MAG: hypothetical protein JSU69_02700 [candidate division Zixibacteria bacterium]